MATSELWDNAADALGPHLRGLQSKAPIAILVGLLLVAAGFFFTLGPNPEPPLQTLFHAYLIGYLFWFGVTAGSLGLLMLHHTVGGGWGFIIRRQLEAGSRLLGLTVVLFVPVVIGIWFGMYPWMDPRVQAEPSVRVKLPFLNPWTFIVVSVILFGTWMLYASAMNKWGALQNQKLSRQEEIDNSARLTVVGASGLVWYVLSMTFASVLWVMSLTPTWISSIFGFLTVASQALSTLALMVALFPVIMGGKPLLGAIPQKYFRDLGNLMLAFTMLWAYMSFSQYLITFSGNTTEEVVWYVPRTHGYWDWISIGVILFHFIIPFMVLVTGALGTLKLKDNPYSLSKIAAYVVLVRFLDLWWWVAPSFRPHLSLNPAEVGFPLLLGGIWIWFWAAELLKAPTLAPKHDPRLEAYLHEVAEHA